MNLIAENKKPIAIALLIVAVLGGVGYQQYNSRFRSTENAYLNADDGEKVTMGQAAPNLFDFGLPAEEILGIRLAK